MSRKVVIIGAGMGGLTAALRLATRLQRPRGRGLRRSRRRGGGLEREASALMPARTCCWIAPGCPGPSTRWGSTSPSGSRCVASRTSTRSRPPTDRSCAFTPTSRRRPRGSSRPGPAGPRYREFVESISIVHKRASSPADVAPRPRHADPDRGVARPPVPPPPARLRPGPRAPPAVADAVAIWTHVAGQTTAEAPSPLAFVASVLRVGASIRGRTRRRADRPGGGGRRGGGRVPVRDDRHRHPARTDEPGASRPHRARPWTPTPSSPTATASAPTWSSAPDAVPGPARRRRESLPLQSPGVCAYLAVRGDPSAPISASAPGRRRLCRLLVTPAAILPHTSGATAGRRPV